MKRIRTIFFEKATDVPNSSLRCSSTVPSCRIAADKARAFREVFKLNGWTGVWTDTIYDYTHFDSNRHEVLGVAEGKVTLRLGEEIAAHL